jgi:hypothetical protein
MSDQPMDFLLRLADQLVEAEKTGWANRVEDAWAKWSTDTTGVACLDSDALFQTIPSHVQLALAASAARQGDSRLLRQGAPTSAN